MALRLKYAGIVATAVEPDLQAALNAFINSVPAGETAYILPTYTAMLALRKLLADRGAVKKVKQL